MRKNQKFTAIIKGALATALSLSMIVTSLAVMPTVAQAEDAVPVKVLDFDKGLREFKGFNFNIEDQVFAEGEGDPNFTIVKSPSVMYKKVGDQVGSGEKADANGFIFTGTGSLAKYHTTVTSNQPATMYDDVKGTVYVLFDTFELPTLVKELEANVMVVPEGADPTTTAPVADPDASAALDAERKVGDVVREALTVKCAAEITNPLAGSTSDAVSITYWAYIPAGTAKDAALMVFDNSTNVVDEDGAIVETVANATEVFYDADSVAAPAGTWAHVAMVVTADGAKFYVNGAETTESYITGDATVAALTAPKKLILGGSNNGVVDTVYDTRIDDISFYETALTAEQILLSYETGRAEMTATTDVTAPAKVFKLDDLTEVTDLGKDSISVVDETINDASVKVIKVEENKASRNKTGFVLNENPFAGEELDGLTVGFWVKQETNCSNNLMFMDDLKAVYNPKEPDISEEARTWLSITNAASASFEEGSYYNCAGKIKNTYSFASAVTDEEITAAKDRATAWQYITLTVNNGSLQLYVNGQPLTNQTPFVEGVRFMDGYQASVDDIADVTKVNGIFGGTNNQCATTMMTFLGYEDTKMYFGWEPSSDKLSARSGESYYYNISCYKSDMTAEEVAALYNQELAALSGEDDKVDVLYGDVDGNAAVDAADALLVLKSVVKLETLDETQTVAADVDGETGVTANDALSILKKVVKIIDKFPVEE